MQGHAVEDTGEERRQTLFRNPSAERPIGIVSNSSIDDAFEMFDFNKDGKLDKLELKLAIAGLDLSNSLDEAHRSSSERRREDLDKEVDKLFSQFDTDGDNELDKNEFTNMMKTSVGFD